MKFRNKATKEIRKAEMRDDGIYLYSETSEEWRKCDWKVLAKYWEEYREEPKEYWVVDYLECGVDKLKYCPEDHAQDDFNKDIGNYFETREEAELAVRKLKAWERLKDKEFKFNKWTIPEEPKTPHIKLIIEAEMDVPDSPYDLDLLFLGGEECIR